MKPKAYSLVLYKNQPAIVITLDSDKIEIDTPSGKKKVREKDVEFLHEGPVKELSRVISAALPDGNLLEAYEFFAGERPSFAEIAELVWGSYAPESSWPIWKELSSSPWFSCTVPSEPISLRSKEEVETIIRKADAKKTGEAEREAFRARLAASLKAARASNAPSVGTEGVQLPDDAKFLQDVEALALGNTDKSRTLKDSGIAETPQNAHRALLATGYWTRYVNPHPARHGHTIRSSTVAIDQPTDTDDLLDLTHLDSFAIDNEWSTDPDDAVSIDGDRLWVHVADPATTVAPDTPADIDARARGSTLYIPEGAARMLEDNALQYFALGLSETSRALSFRVGFTETGAIDDVAIYRTRIRVTRLTYAQASSRKDDPTLAPLFAIAERNIARRAAAGAVFIELPEVHISVSQDMPPNIRIERIQAEKAADMVREMMLLAGEAAARFAFKNGIPFQYVSQETPDIPEKIPEGLAGEYRKRRSMKSRKVGTTPADHAGLGLGMYSQVTSPLRRYGDLVAHQQLHLFLDGKHLMDTDDMLTRIASGDSASRECTLAERESNLHWILNYLSDHPDWTGEAIVVERTGPLTTILIPELAQEARLSLSDSLDIGATLRVKVGNINISEQTVTYIPL